MPVCTFETDISDDATSYKASAIFNRWLIDTCTDSNLSAQQRELKIQEWDQAPSARFCHPGEEHLLSLHVCYGIVCASVNTAQVVFDQPVMGKKVCRLLWR